MFWIMKKGIFINITLSLLSLFSFLLLLEMGLRFFSIDTPTVEVSSKQWSRLDPTFGAINIPNRKYRYNIGKYSVSYEFNSKGIRGPEYSYLKPDGEYRILILEIQPKASLAPIFVRNDLKYSRSFSAT